ncbi:MAG: DUF445 domain-containing protein [Nocardioidaceae bacterium]
MSSAPPDVELARSLRTDTPADEARRAGLRRMRMVASSLLVLAAIVYIFTQDRDGAWGYVNAAAEASMVGAIADWFAVTALFRHPLRLRIPHTALIPRRKDLLAVSLQEFFTDNFLAEDVVRARVADAGVSRRIGGWLSAPVHARRVVDEASGLVRTALLKIDDRDVATLIESELLPRLVDEPLSEVTGRLLADVVDEGAHTGLVDLALSESHRWLSTNQETVARILATRAPWWTPQWLDEKVTDRLHVEALAWVADIRDDPHNPARKALDDLLRDLARDLQHDPDTMERAERLKRRVLTQPQVVVAATALWRSLRRALVTSLEDPDSTVRERAAVALADFGQRVLDDAALRHRLDAYAADAAAHVVNRYGSELATVITDTIQRWDGQEAADRIELHVGRDLQFIRINGTLVGGLAGLLIHSLAQVL